MFVCLCYIFTRMQRAAKSGHLLRRQHATAKHQRNMQQKRFICMAPPLHWWDDWLVAGCLWGVIKLKCGCNFRFLFFRFYPILFVDAAAAAAASRKKAKTKMWQATTEMWFFLRFATFGLVFRWVLTFFYLLASWKYSILKCSITYIYFITLLYFLCQT